MGLKIEEGPSPIKGQSLNERPRAWLQWKSTHMDSVGDSQLSYSADTESESNSSSTCSSSSSSTKTVSLLDLLRAPTPSTLARKRKIGVNSAPPQGKKRASGQGEKI